jgi:hypothetical protein
LAQDSLSIEVSKRSGSSVERTDRTWGRSYKKSICKAKGETAMALGSLLPWRYVERSYGSFERRLALPSEVDPNKAKASFKKGVLTITIPKSETAQKAKKISISA